MMCITLMQTDADSHDILLVSPDRQEAGQMTDRMRYEGGQYYVKSPEEMAAAVSICARGSGKYTEDRRPLPRGD